MPTISPQQRYLRAPEANRVQSTMADSLAEKYGCTDMRGGGLVALL